MLLQETFECWMPQIAACHKESWHHFYKFVDLFKISLSSTFVGGVNLGAAIAIF
jgi:hypothetical protein